MSLGSARNGSVLRFEAWGEIDMQELQRNWGTDEGRARAVWGYLEELQNIAVVELSHREQRVVTVTLLIDAGGLTTRHAKLVGPLQTASVF